MNKPSIIFILLLSILSFSIISVSAQIIDISIDGNAAVYNCYPYDYNVTLRILQSMKLQLISTMRLPYQ